MKRRAQTKERKGEDHGETSPSPPQWQDYHTEKEGDKKQCGGPPPNTALSFFERNKASTPAEKVFPSKLLDV